ncbi:MAG: 50S ribosomal protein L25/general stress protein Ctc [Legionellales bacterium]|nr:50S ribosomal protein L25/general stress protein Ctc [Legionellales bacterium]|tara:strand:+ start:330 stop:980 length:651 start_codon:yes stop_codon:yes gene_type:complete
MSIEFKLSANKRSSKGSNACYRLRKAKKIPAVLYGLSKPEQLIELDEKQVNQIQSHPEFYSHVIQLSIAGKVESVLIKDWQKKVTGSEFTHLDFYRVSSTKKIHAKIPVHFTGEADCIGIKNQKGIAHHAMTELMLECLPGHLPEFIAVDISHLEAGQVLHLSDVKLPDHVSLYHHDLAKNDPVVVAINSPQKETDSEAISTEAGDTESGESTTEL